MIKLEELSYETILINLLVMMNMLPRFLRLGILWKYRKDKSRKLADTNLTESVHEENCIVLTHLAQPSQRTKPEVIKLFSCSTQLSMNFVLLINLKLLIIANSFLLNTAEHENFSANKYENANICWHLHIY